MTAADRTEPERLLRWGLGHLPYEQLDPTDSFDELEGYSTPPAAVAAPGPDNGGPSEACGNASGARPGASNDNDQEVPF